MQERSSSPLPATVAAGSQSDRTCAFAAAAHACFRGDRATAAALALARRPTGNEHPSGGGEQLAGTAVCERHIPLPSIGHAHQPMSAAGALAAFSAHPVRQSR
ncbi:hypothetical protein EIJ50_11405 [Xanthomonas perforans]|nr:hypothetical protein EIJ50_11405 [Xanthomonas perforans]